MAEPQGIIPGDTFRHLKGSQWGLEPRDHWLDHIKHEPSVGRQCVLVPAKCLWKLQQMFSPEEVHGQAPPAGGGRTLH